MAHYEWVLKTPSRKTFRVRVAAAGSSFARTEEVDGEATAIRLVSATNDYVNARFFVRFIYGQYKGDRFEPSVRDDGIVIGGPNFHELMLSANSSIAAPDLLQLCARIMKWDGEMRQIDSATSTAK